MEHANHHNHASVPKEVVLGKGRRLTKARAEIHTLLEKSLKPLSIRDIVALVSANEASVYRTVRMLEADNRIAPIRYPDGTVRYELTEHHHHHIICVGCGFTQHVPCGAQNKVPTIRSNHFSRVLGHEVTYFGECTSCAE
jgi:Fur family transcriptional regulator, ferric uptake regulator